MKNFRSSFTLQNVKGVSMSEKWVRHVKEMDLVRGVM